MSLPIPKLVMSRKPTSTLPGGRLLRQPLYPYCHCVGICVRICIGLCVRPCVGFRVDPRSLRDWPSYPMVTFPKKRFCKFLFLDLVVLYEKYFANFRSRGFLQVNETFGVQDKRWIEWTNFWNICS